MNITKMQGLGNDFIIIEDEKGIDLSGLSKRLCTRRLNIGADGIIVVCKSDKADTRMRIINADGSEAEMCGNGIRCFARYVYDRGIVSSKVMTVETLAGIMSPEIVEEAGQTLVKVDMGSPYFDREKIPMIGTGSALCTNINVDRRDIEVSSLLMGVPHTMVFRDEISDEEVRELGPKIETNKAYPRKTNVNFVKIIDNRTIHVRTWERGAGLTLACGTGSCASVVASSILGKTGREVDVMLSAGKLHINYEQENKVFMTGNAEYVFEGRTL